MKHGYPLFLTLLVLTFSWSPHVVTAAERPNVRTMAAILLNLNHYPSASEQEILQLIAHDRETSPEEQVLARALMYLQHTVRPDDKALLQALLSILATLNHTPSAADKAKLTQLLQAPE
jgi:hypothetical protein